MLCFCDYEPCSQLIWTAMVFTVGASGGDGKAARNAAVHQLSYIFSGLPHDVHGLGQSADGFVAGKSEGMGPSASIQGTSVSLFERILKEHATSFEEGRESGHCSTTQGQPMEPRRDDGPPRESEGQQMQGEREPAREEEFQFAMFAEI